MNRNAINDINTKYHHYNDDLDMLKKLSKMLLAEYSLPSSSKYFLSIIERAKTKCVQDSSFIRLLILLIFFSVDEEDFFIEYDLLQETKDNHNYSEDNTIDIKKYFSYDLLRYKTNHQAVSRFYIALSNLLDNREMTYHSEINDYMKMAEKKIIDDDKASTILDYDSFLSFFKLFFDDIQQLFSTEDNNTYYLMIPSHLIMNYRIFIIRPEFIVDIVNYEHAKKYPLLHNNGIFVETLHESIAQKLLDAYSPNNSIYKILITLRENWFIFKKIYDSKPLLDFLVNAVQLSDSREIRMKQIYSKLSCTPTLIVMEKAVNFSYLLSYHPYKKQRIAKNAIQNFIVNSLSTDSDCFIFYIDNLSILKNLNKDDFIDLFYYACSID